MRLRKEMRRGAFAVRADTAFREVMAGCARQRRPGQNGTWITPDMIAGYTALHGEGLAHSIEAWRGGRLVGGLYGVSLGGAFFGESMFHRGRDASKVALVHLVARLKAGGYRLLDTQFVTDHLKTFGATAVSRRQYHKLLEAALVQHADFATLPLEQPIGGADALKLATGMAAIL